MNYESRTNLLVGLGVATCIAAQAFPAWMMPLVSLGALIGVAAAINYLLNAARSEAQRPVSEHNESGVSADSVGPDFDGCEVPHAKTDSEDLLDSVEPPAARLMQFAKLAVHLRRNEFASNEALKMYAILSRPQYSMTRTDLLVLNLAKELRAQRAAQAELSRAVNQLLQLTASKFGDEPLDDDGPAVNEGLLSQGGGPTRHLH